MRKLIGGLFIASLLGGVAYAEQLVKEQKDQGSGIKVVASEEDTNDGTGRKYIQVVFTNSSRKDAKLVKGRAWFIKGDRELDACPFEVVIQALGKDKMELPDCTATEPDGLHLVIDSVEAPAAPEPAPAPEPLPE